jgi:hypothetical protein
MKRSIIALIILLTISFIYYKPIDKPKQPVAIKDMTKKQQLRYFNWIRREQGWIK